MQTSFIFKTQYPTFDPLHSQNKYFNWVNKLCKLIFQYLFITGTQKYNHKINNGAVLIFAAVLHEIIEFGRYFQVEFIWHRSELH